jgi:hypothetical protein
MKKIILIALLVAFVSASNAGTLGQTFELTKADFSQYSLLQSVDADNDVRNWGGGGAPPCSSCERNLDSCLSSGLPGCFSAFRVCINTCVGIFP